MDYLKHKEDIKYKKIKIGDKSNEVKNFIIYFFHNDDIVYIGKTSNIMQYIEERKEKYNSNYYNYEEVLTKSIDNYLVDLILNIQPIYNGNVPKNTKYISNTQAKNKYFINKREFKEIYNQYGGIEYKSQIFIEKIIFDDLYAREPYHADMPKIGRRINLKSDYITAPLNIWGGQVLDTLYDIDGNPIEAYRDYHPDIKEEYKYLNFLEENEYEVIHLIDSNNFEAVKLIDGSKVILNASNKSTTWTSFNDKGLWIDAVDESTSTGLKHNYLKTIDNSY